MKYTEEQLRHVVFLSEVVLQGNKRGMMEETLLMLLYIVKSLKEAEFSEDVSEEIARLIEQVEERLREENGRLQEIQINLAMPNRRKPMV
ncbi:hypothetical protein SY83_20500 [Paenibacillus swuensis]|uniref:Uncharacterized protein n=1 Tax=Paenibacillus swuensis TaxID=1178515 RepID=A0A172TMR3_9BACL|nr:hypothetical protein [Paenibacillus swuensis]ANE48272.1 hypothetical protein SY83_20500 [Paenibacillus swuensis]